MHIGQNSRSKKILKPKKLCALNYQIKRTAKASVKRVREKEITGENCSDGRKYLNLSFQRTTQISVNCQSRDSALIHANNK